MSVGFCIKYLLSKRVQPSDAGSYYVEKAKFKELFQPVERWCVERLLWCLLHFSRHVDGNGWCTDTHTHTFIPPRIIVYVHKIVIFLKLTSPKRWKSSHNGCRIRLPRRLKHSWEIIVRTVFRLASTIISQSSNALTPSSHFFVPSIARKNRRTETFGKCKKKTSRLDTLFSMRNRTSAQNGTPA